MTNIRKNIFIIAGVAGIIFGIMGAVPSFLQANYGVATISSILMVGGLILLAIAFGD